MFEVNKSPFLFLHLLLFFTLLKILCLRQMPNADFQRERWVY